MEESALVQHFLFRRINTFKLRMIIKFTSCLGFLHAPVPKLKEQTVSSADLGKHKLFHITRLISESICATFELFYTRPDVFRVFIGEAGVDIINCSIYLSHFTWSHLLPFITDFLITGHFLIWCV